MKKILLLFSCIISSILPSQNPLNHAMKWHFGTNCSLDFISGSPISGGSNINTFEGCAAISDENNGSLLFYTDGENVYDALGSLMPNGTGLFGNVSSAQSSVIVPVNFSGVPKYYIFTSDQSGYAGANKGVYYSIVDMTLNGGLGDVTIKNVPLLTVNHDEKLAAVRACNGQDAWLVTHRFLTDSFFVFPITSSGVGTPVISKIGSVHNNISGQYYEGVGTMAISPDGDKLALSIYQFQNMVEVFHFNQTTGVITNSINLSATSLSLSAFEPYGVAFSPDSRKLYFSHSNENWPGPAAQIFQVDLSTWNQSAIASSAYLVSSLNTNYFWNLALAPDNKIYVDKGYWVNQNYLDVISNPNISGAGCNFISNAVQIPNGIVRNGLPSFYRPLLAGDVSCADITGLSTNSDNEEVTLYPNPCTNYVHVHLKGNKDCNVTLMNGLGQVTWSENKIPGEVRIDMRSLPRGIYFLKLDNGPGKTIALKKIIRE